MTPTNITGSALITGGAGYLGRGILRRAHAEGWPARFTVYSRDEEKHDRLRRRYPDVRTVLGDVRDKDRLAAVLPGHDVVIHAGSVKFVVDAEYHPSEAVAVNVDGTRNVIETAERAGVQRVVFISTDKACRPVNAYGMTKAIGERLVADAGCRGDTVYTSVRYGNVVGSTGSVVPLFHRQLREDGAVSVTNPSMTRFYMSVDEAIDCILFALSSERVPGSITVPRLRAMRMGDMAAAIAGGMPVRVIGARPGEKEHEELVHHQESVRARRVGGYYELVPVRCPESEAPFTVASHTPHRGWLSDKELLEMVADSEGV